MLGADQGTPQGRTRASNCGNVKGVSLRTMGGRGGGPGGSAAGRVEPADPRRLDRVDHAALSALVVGGDVGAVIAVQLVGEGVVVVGLDPRPAADLDVLERVVDVEDQQ